MLMQDTSVFHLKKYCTATEEFMCDSTQNRKLREKNCFFRCLNQEEATYDPRKAKFQI
jgi:hypothetical protein